MSRLSTKELDFYSNKILDDYDSKNPSTIFKEKIKIIEQIEIIIIAA